MTLTDKQKKLAWIVGGILVLIHSAPGIWNNVRHAWEARAHVASAPKPPAIHYAPAVSPTPLPSAPAQPAVALPDPQFVKLIGKWTGNAVMPGGDFCKVDLDLRASPDKPDLYTGYSSMSCGPVFAFAAHQYSAKGLPSGLIGKLAPVSTILSGSPENGEIHLHFDKTITIGPDGCQPVSYVLTPFDQQLGATFDRGTCQGGKLVMKRAQR